MTKILTFKYKSLDGEFKLFALRTDSIVKVIEVDVDRCRIEYKNLDSIVIENCAESFSDVLDRWKNALLLEN